MLWKKRDIFPWFVYHSGLKHANSDILYLLKIIKNVYHKVFHVYSWPFNTKHTITLLFCYFIRPENITQEKYYDHNNVSRVIEQFWMPFNIIVYRFWLNGLCVINRVIQYAVYIRHTYLTFVYSFDKPFLIQFRSVVLRISIPFRRYPMVWHDSHPACIWSEPLSLRIYSLIGTYV